MCKRMQAKIFKQGVLARNLLFFCELCFHGDFLSEIRKHVSCNAIANTTCIGQVAPNLSTTLAPLKYHLMTCFIFTQKCFSEIMVN